MPCFALVQVAGSALLEVFTVIPVVAAVFCYYVTRYFMKGDISGFTMTRAERETIERERLVKIE